jgi:hypothetical protein
MRHPGRNDQKVPARHLNPRAAAGTELVGRGPAQDAQDLPPRVGVPWHEPRKVARRGANLGDLRELELVAGQDFHELSRAAVLFKIVRPTISQAGPETGW